MAAYYVYVIELDPGVLVRRRFAAANPGHRKGRACLYVGSSVRTPDHRFDQHKAGFKSNRYVRDFGVVLRPDLFERYNPIPSRKDAEQLEAYLAARLRSEGYAVWTG